MNHQELVEGTKLVISRRIEIHRKDNRGVMACCMMDSGFCAPAFGEMEIADISKNGQEMCVRKKRALTNNLRVPVLVTWERLELSTH
ncbi:hypothetical protein [Arcticibacter sp.]|uniref:hypothetical protein n=1 Tax=Arcticibacter sp. TaxID=1872630 RepID=UPI00388EC9E8